MHIAIVDVGLGNLRSVERALVRAASEGGIAAQVSITRDAEAIARADKVVVPGQGAFRDCARALDAGLGDAVRGTIQRGTPYLGICLGMQVLFASSEEAPGCSGLGIFEGEVVRLGDRDPGGERLKIPHIGWNTVDAQPGASPMLPASPTYFYFVHSYAVRPRDPGVTAATTTYGAPFVCAVARDNVFAVQFHPEKSQGAGLALLTRFLRA
ncbi:MAG TPA: imidazole glycerol phosphate synthase subunit HisH [Polyangiaceae bacterium]